MTVPTAEMNNETKMTEMVRLFLLLILTISGVSIAEADQPASSLEIFDSASDNTLPYLLLLRAMIDRFRSSSELFLVREFFRSSTELSRFGTPRLCTLFVLSAGGF